MTWKLFDEVWKYLTINHPLGENMTFLKKLAQILLRGAELATGLGPLVSPLLGSAGSKAVQGVTTVANDLTAVGTAVLQIETALQGKTGPDKFAAALALVGPILRTSELVAGKKIADEAKLELGIQEITQGVVDLMNSLHEDAAKG